MMIPCLNSCRSELVGGVRQMLSLDSGMYKTKILEMPWGIINDKEDLDC